MYICDGSVIGENIELPNASLAIMAFSEQAMSHVKQKNETTWSETAQIRN